VVDLLHGDIWVLKVLCPGLSRVMRDQIARPLPTAS
jgi:hypothetical protein